MREYGEGSSLTMKIEGKSDVLFVASLHAIKITSKPAFLPAQLFPVIGAYPASKIYVQSWTSFFGVMLLLLCETDLREREKGWVLCHN